MTNYFLTTAFGLSKIISPFPLRFIWYSFVCSTLSEPRVLLQQNLKHMIPIHFTHVKYYYVFRTRRAWERTWYWRWVKCNCTVIAAVHVRRKAAISRTLDVSKKTFLLTAFPSANTPLPYQSILSCTITSLPPTTQTHTHTFSKFKKISFQATKHWFLLLNIYFSRHVCTNHPHPHLPTTLPSKPYENWHAVKPHLLHLLSSSLFNWLVMYFHQPAH